jgi:hypothetical protein
MNKSNAEHGGQGTTASLSASQSGLESETWDRLPGMGERLEGISRPGIYRIIDDPKSGVVSVSLKQPGTNRGIRLVGRNSLRAYIARCAQEQLADRLAVRGAA